MNALVEQTEFGVTTNSRTVAEVFEKEHRHVLASIDDIVSRGGDRCAPNFRRTSAKVPMPNGGEREVRAYEMDRDGFTLLAMGFTGEKALDWKLAYIEAFNRMEAELQQGQPQNVPVDRIDAVELAPALAIARETRLVFGRKAAQRLWTALGLPDPRRGALPLCEDRPDWEPPTSIAEWMEYGVLVDQDAECHSSALYRAYSQWCDGEGQTAENQTVFGLALSRLGFPPKKSASGNIMRTGLKLLPA